MGIDPRNPHILLARARGLVVEPEGKGVPMPGREDRVPRVTEREFQRDVIALAKANGWLVAHFRTARTVRRDGTVRYQTPVQADGAGYPDLVLLRGSVMLVAELKTDMGRTT